MCKIAGEYGEESCGDGAGEVDGTEGEVDVTTRGGRGYVGKSAKSHLYRGVVIFLETIVLP